MMETWDLKPYWWQKEYLVYSQSSAVNITLKQVHIMVQKNAVFWLLIRVNVFKQFSWKNVEEM